MRQPRLSSREKSFSKAILIEKTASGSQIALKFKPRMYAVIQPRVVTMTPGIH